MKNQPRKALASKNGHRRIPLVTLAVIWLLMDRFNPVGWVVGVVWTLVALVYLLAIFDFFTAEDIELGDKQ